MSQIKALMVDLSSNNGDGLTPHDLQRHYAAGYRLLCLKATQSTTYTWLGARELAHEWHSLGDDAQLWRYHFNGLTGTATAQAHYFMREVMRHHREGDRAILDVEGIPIGPGRVAPSFSSAQARDFQVAMHRDEPGVPTGIYGGPYLLKARGIRPLHGAILWLADYASHIAFIPPGWEHVSAWQNTDRATGVPGISGAVDRSIVHRDVMPHAHAHKPIAKPLAHREAATTLLHELKRREAAGRKVKPGHDRAILRELDRAIHDTLGGKAA